MSFKVLKPADIISKKTIAAIIYGQKGSGKTTLAFSAPNPVLFDFDNGVSRVGFGFEKDVIVLDKFSDYSEALDYIATTDYKTVIVDTLTKLVDMVTLEQCGNGIPSPRDYQIIYNKVKMFLRAVLASGRHLIFVAQDVEVKKSGKQDTFHKPDCPDKVYNALASDMDIIGYMSYIVEAGEDKRSITFNPTAYNDGKNTAEFKPLYSIPTATSDAPLTFMTDTIDNFVSYQNTKDAARAEMWKAIDAAYAEIEKEVAAATDAMSLNEIVVKVRNGKAVGDVKLRASKAIAERAKGLGLTLNKESKLYE